MLCLSRFFLGSPIRMYLLTIPDGGSCFIARYNPGEVQQMRVVAQHTSDIFVSLNGIRAFVWDQVATQTNVNNCTVRTTQETRRNATSPLRCSTAPRTSKFTSPKSGYGFAWKPQADPRQLLQSTRNSFLRDMYYHVIGAFSAANSHHWLKQRQNCCIEISLRLER